VADAVVLLTDHDAFDDALVVAHARYVLDTRGRLVGDQVEHL
jgi:UDP-N-acetyl-D-mannosaminuronate dehydrogenase